MPDQPALMRHWTLLRTLSARHRGATLRELADDAGVTSKTIQRDLEMLRRLGFPLIHTTSDHNRRHWKLDAANGLLQLQFTVEEAAALYLGRQFLEPLAGTFFFDGAQRAFQKIRATLGDAALRHLEKLAAAFYQKSHGWSDYSRQGELIDELVRAIEDRHLTVITYQSLRTTEPVTHYDIHPLAIVWHKHALYLLAHSCDHNAIRTFKVDRISSVDVQQLQFTRPRDFDPHKLLATSFGIFEGTGPTQTIRIRFTPEVSRVVAERKHHPSQRLSPQSDGSLLAEFELSSFEEISSWILSWGEHAEVLEPTDLRERVKAILTAALTKYNPKPTTKRGHERSDRPSKQKPR